MTFNFSRDDTVYSNIQPAMLFEVWFFLTFFPNTLILVTTALLHDSSISLSVLVILAQFKGFGEIKDGGRDGILTSRDVIVLF